MLKNNIFYFFIGFIYGSYLFYIRILLTRVPAKILFNWSVLWLLVCLVAVIFFGFKAYQESYRLLKNTKEYKQSKFRVVNFLKKKVVLKFKLIYDSSIDSLYYFLIDKPKIGYNVKRIVAKLIYIIESLLKKNLFLYKEKINIYFFFLLMPRLFVSIAFFLDVIIYQEFFYLYKIIWVLIITLLWRVVFYLIKEQLNNHLTFFRIFFEVTHISDSITILLETGDLFTPKIIFKRRKLPLKLKKKYAYTQSAKYYDMMQKEFGSWYFVKQNFIYFFDAASDSSVYAYSNFLIYLFMSCGWLYFTLRLLLRLFLGSYLLLKYEFLLFF